MVALIRPDAWNLPLFLHVLGAMLLFGTVGTVALAGFATRTHADHLPLLTRVTQRTYLLGVIPAYILMRAGAQWIDSKEFPGGGEPGWVGVGFLVSDAGAVLLLIVGILLVVRRQRVLLAVPVLTAIYVVALAVAWIAMSGKP
jgi:hypothetical protein